MEKKQNYMIFWLGQSVSQLGSAMTAFALTIWAYEKTQSAMTVSLMTFCNYLPYILVSIFAGGFVDRHSKKMILILSDTIAAILTVGILIKISRNQLSMEQIYVVNTIIGLTNAFQSPAAAVVTGALVPEGQYEKASGLQSFASNLIMVASPMLSGMLIGFAGLRFVLLADLLSFTFCMATLYFVKIKQRPTGDHGQKADEEQPHRRQTGSLQNSLKFLKNEKGIFYIMVSMAIINFFSRLTYENILSPMLLARSGHDARVLSVVSGVLGIGGIIGGVIVASGKGNHSPLKIVYISAGISFLFGDLLMGMGRSLPAWFIAGLAASVPIPFVIAGQTMILYRIVPEKIQGSIFALRNAIQYSTIPVGILLGGYLADYVFEPFMISGQPAAVFLMKLVGTGGGSGMAVMFLCTGVLGSLSCLIGYKNRHIKELVDRMTENRT